MLYLSHWERETKVLGPGRRYALWVQGCKKRCPGCVFPEGQPINKNGVWKHVEEIAIDILSTPNLRGLTISGGEPFLQATALLKLVTLIGDKSKLDIMVYSGYTLEELRQQHDVAVDGLLSQIDILVDGEYIEELNHNTAYRGSDNQRLHFLSAKYRPFQTMMEQAKNRSIEFVCRENGELFMIGLPAKNFRNDFMAMAASVNKSNI